MSAKNQNLITRPPIVVVMGHIDHGKTTLLDHIRKTNVTEKEIGGITQSIGAYEVQVSTKGGESRKITFIDTPGHEAFSNMRSRGTKVADIAILVVAADDGVKAQTKEAIKAISKAGLPFAVALNKIDKVGDDYERVKKELSEQNVLIEEWGGKVPLVPISAKVGTGVDELLETIVLLADLEDLKANQEEEARGVVIESHRDAKRGNTATLVIQSGTLRRGEYVVSGSAHSPVRIFEDYKGHTLEEATFSAPVLIVGFNELPGVGSKFVSAQSRKDAETLIREQQVIESVRKVDKEKSEVVGDEEKDEEEKRITVVPIVIKADTTGSLEVVEAEIKKFEQDDVVIKVLKSDVGDINENDIKLAQSAENSIVFGFSVSVDKNVSELAKIRTMEIGTFDIIYELVDWAKSVIEKRLPKEITRTVLGTARIIKIFKKDGDRQIVGGMVTSGAIKDGKKFRLIRRDKELGEGSIVELQHNKIKVKEVEAEKEFGALVVVGVAIAPKDVLEVFEEKVIERKL